MKNHINQNFLINAQYAVQWYRPESENEFTLIELLRDALALQDEIEQLHSDNEELQADLETVTKERDDLLIDCNNQTDTIKQLEADIERMERGG